MPVRPAQRTALAASERSGDGRRVLLIGRLDRFANGVRLRELERFLRARGHEVRVVDTRRFGRASGADGSLRSRLPRRGFMYLVLYAVQAAGALLTKRWGFGRRHLSYHVFLADYGLRRRLLRAELPLDDYDLIVCQIPQDAGVLTTPTSAQTLYDCATPWADEFYYEGRLTERQHRRLRRHEADLFERVDHLAFHWESYAGYAVEHYGIDGGNLMTLNWGCEPSAERAEYRDPPRVVYLGLLAGRFVDLPLLSRLTKLYPHIDVYGAPPPDPALGLNYRGYAPPTVLRDYQLGLITTTRDELRRDGFSAKHLHYLASGLPVLVPAWRRRLDLLRGSVPYEEDSFLSVIEALTDEAQWRRASDEAYAQAQRLRWERTLAPLDALLRGMPGVDGDRHGEPFTGRPASAPGARARAPGRG